MCLGHADDLDALGNLARGKGVESVQVAHGYAQ